MVTSAFPISILDTNCVSAFDADPPQSQFIRRPPDLVIRAQAGDPQAFTEIYQLHKKRVLSICVRMVHDLSLAEDLAQEAFVQLHRKLGSFRGDSAFTTWLHRITVNTVLMQLRKRVLPVVSLDDMMTKMPEQHAGREFGTRDLAQAGVVDRLALKRAVDALAPGYRCVYILHDVEGFAHWEIAEMQKCSMGNSKSQLHKARRALRSALATQGVPVRASAMIH
jgi:RNA polymerase sigma-70 factor (ECF subfamily)